MNVKKGVLHLFRGWVPKELRISSDQQTKKPQNPVAGVRFGLFIFIMSFAGSLLGGLDNVLGWGLLSGIGLYVFVILLIACITVVAITKILSHNKKRSAKT